MDVYRRYFSEAVPESATPSDMNFGVNLHTVGHHVHPAGAAYPDPQHPSSHAFDWQRGRRLQEFQIVYVARGSGVYECEASGTVRVEAGTIMLHFPGVWHRYKPDPASDWEEFWVGFGGHFSEYLMGQACFDPQHTLIRIGFNLEFLQVFQRLIDTVKYEGVAYRQLASCLVVQLLGLVYASALLHDRTGLRQEQIIRAVRLHIHDDWAQSVDFEALASEQNVSYEWLRKTFKNVTGVSPGQYLLNLKIEKTAQMLRETSLTMAEVAQTAGFESEFYFSRLFKKKLGVSPTAYRRNG
jgi:AraC-like DNA-binding protein